MGKGKVLLDWMEELTWKQQSVILSGLRGPDTPYCHNIKKIVRWLRGVTQNNADKSHSYMREENLPPLKEIEKEFEFTTVHYGMHLIHSLEIIGYKHPDKKISKISKDYYVGLTKYFLHLNPETKAQLEKRLKDID